MDSVGRGSMEKQKRVALINDVTGFGRCSTVVQLPIISAMGVQCCIFPTAILSAHTAYPSYYFDDYTRHMQSYMDNWKALGVTFDGISTGFLGSKEQIELVITFLKTFQKEGTKVVVDPVMGDDGILYETYTEEMCQEMKRLIQYADVITPNLTEAYRLLQLGYKEGTLTEEDLAKQLSLLGPKKVVITGIDQGDNVGNYFYERSGKKGWIWRKKVAESRPGTGDVFSAIITAGEMLHLPFEVSIQLAADFITKGLEKTIEQDVPHNDGICFELVLGQLIQFIQEKRK